MLFRCLINSSPPHSPSSHLHMCRDHSVSLYHDFHRIVICLTTCFTGIRSLQPSSNKRLCLSNITDRPLDVHWVGCFFLLFHPSHPSGTIVAAMKHTSVLSSGLGSCHRPVGPIRAVMNSGKLWRWPGWEWNNDNDSRKEKRGSRIRDKKRTK